MKGKIFLIVAAIVVALTLTAFVIVPTSNMENNDSKNENECENIFEFVDDDPVGQTWIEEEFYDGFYHYVLKATNVSGECFHLSGEIMINATGKIIPVRKNIPEWANTKSKAIKVISLTQPFTKIESSFEALDCIW